VTARRRRGRSALARLVALAWALPAPGRAEDGPDLSAASIVREVGIDQRLGERIALDTRFVDEGGRSVALAEYFGTKPVVLVLAYNRCPMLCTQVLNGLVHALRAVDLEPGRDFEILTVSIDPRETSELAARTKASYVREYGREGAAAGWHFLVGPEESIRRLAGEVGFRYVHDPKTDEYAHASGFVVLTPSGVLSRYFYGLEHPAGDVRLALVESSEGRVGTLADQVLLLCYHYDPRTGRYGFAILNVLRALGVLTVLGIVAFVVFMSSRPRRAPPLRTEG
jgi:protein SCO1/2